MICFLTPGLMGGGWNVIKTFIKTLLKYDNTITINIFSAGPIEKNDFLLKEKRIKIHKIPWLNYNKYVNFLEENFVLNILFNFPFLFFCFVKSLTKIKEVQTFVCNGILSFIPLFFIKTIKKNIKIFVWVHTDLRFSNTKVIKKIIKLIAYKVNHFLVNSDDVKNDLINTGITSVKILKIPNVVEEIKLDRLKWKKLNFLEKYEFKVLFIGRFVKYKHILLYLKVAEELSSDKICFVFVGTGELQNEVEKVSKINPHIYYLGELTNIETRNLYSKFNITLSYADETYVSMTALESLYAGTPVLYPDISSAPTKFCQKIKIRNKIIPEPIGFKVKTSKKDFCEKIKKLYLENFPSYEVRKKCQNFIRKYHSSKNFYPVISKILCF